MNGFIVRPHLAYVGGKRPWVLETPCAYVTNVESAQEAYPHGLIEIPAGYPTDLASVPRVPGIYWRFGGKAVLPAIVHDWLYEHGEPALSRKAADLVFLEVMADEGDPPWATTRRIMYRAVRIGGARAWRRYRRTEVTA